MSSQLSDGFTCFMGTNPRDPTDEGCSDAAALLMVYIIINFMYNIMMLAITKKGSAVLLVTSQALSLPITNIAFTLKPLMGANAEPLSINDLAGLVLVCIGFMHGFGFAKNFMVAQGPPGQMAYAHFEDHDEMVVTTKVAVEPEQLADFVLGGIIREHILLQDHFLQSPDAAMEYRTTVFSENQQLLDARDDLSLRRRQLKIITPLEACTTAIMILKRATELVEKQEQILRCDDESATHLTSPAMLNRLVVISKRNCGGGHLASKSSYGT